MRKIFCFVACLCISMSSAACANEQMIVRIQTSVSATLNHAQIMENGDIWISGANWEDGQYWLAQVASDGEINDMYTDIGYIISRVAQYESKRYVLGYADNEATGERYTRLIPLLAKGITGSSVPTKYYADAMIDVSSGMLVYHSTKDTPWLMQYDANMNPFLTIEQPQHIAQDLDAGAYSLSVSAAKESNAGGLLLLGISSSNVCFFFEIDSRGEYTHYMRIPLDFAVTSAEIFDDCILMVGNEVKNGAYGTTYIAYADLKGSVIWKKEISLDDGFFVAQRIYKHTDGFILYGYNNITDDHGNHETLHILTLTNEGDVAKWLELSEIQDINANGVFHDGTFYAFGNSVEDKGLIVFEKIKIDTSWFSKQ